MNAKETSAFGDANGRPRIAIIGISGYAKLLLQSLLATLETEPGFIAAATVINRPQEAETCRFLESRGCMIYDDYRDMLDAWRGRLDLCLVPVSIHWHAPICIDALRAGAHVLVEKPLAGDLVDAHAIVDASRVTGKFVAVGFQDMYSPANWAIKRFILSRRLGRLRDIHVTGSWPRSQTYYSRNRWAGQATCDGRAVFDSPLSNAFAHHLNLGLFFAASALEEAARLSRVEGRLLRYFPIGTFDTAAIEMVTSDDVGLRCCVTHADSQSREPEILIEMEHGVLRWSHGREAVAHSWDGEEFGAWSLSSGETNRQHMLREVLSCVRQGEAPPCTAKFALAHVEAVDEMHQCLKIVDDSALQATSNDGRANSWEPVDDLLLRLSEELDKRKTRRTAVAGSPR